MRHFGPLLVFGCVWASGCSTCTPAPPPHLQEELARGRDALRAHAQELVAPGATPGPPQRPQPPPPTRADNRARLLINGEASYLERLALIDQAERSILIQALIFKADVVGRAIADRLIERKRERPELDIRVIVDAYANIRDYDAQMLYFELSDAGIDVQGYEPLYLEWVNEVDLDDWTSGNKRYHEKYFIVDGTRAVVGGMNIGDEYARVATNAPMIWRDQDIYLEGPVVQDIEEAFNENFAAFRGSQERRPRVLEADSYWSAWRRVHPRLREAVQRSLAHEAPWASARPAPIDVASLRARRIESHLHDDVPVQFVRSRPRLGERWIDAVYLDRIREAESSVVIANAYFVPTDALRDALAAAARRGVEVTVITNSKATNDIPLINDAGRLSYAPLLDAGVHLYEWHGERHGEGTLHAKLAVFDERTLVIGSYNLDPRSLALNSEDVVVVTHRGVARELYARVMHEDLRFAEAVTPEQARQWARPELLPSLDGVPQTPWWDPSFDVDRFELFLIRQAQQSL